MSAQLLQALHALAIILCLPLHAFQLLSPIVQLLWVIKRCSTEALRWAADQLGMEPAHLRLLVWVVSLAATGVLLITHNP